MSAPLDVVLVGCSATKLDRSAPARELYRGDLFQKSLAYAELTAPHVYVVSALHGLVPLDDVIAPYNRTIADIDGVRERDRWGERVIDALARRHAGAPIAVTLLVGEAYAKHLRGKLAFRRSVAFRAEYRWPHEVEPLRRMQIGERKAWLAGEIGRLKAEATARAVVSR